VAAAASLLPAAAQREILFLPFAGDDSDGSDYTELAAELQEAGSDVIMDEALDGVAAVLAGAAHPLHQPLGVLALRCASNLFLSLKK
jgi:hypothetical protein